MPLAIARRYHCSPVVSAESRDRNVSIHSSHDDGACFGAFCVSSHATTQSETELDHRAARRVSAGDANDLTHQRLPLHLDADECCAQIGDGIRIKPTPTTRAARVGSA